MLGRRSRDVGQLPREFDTLIGGRRQERGQNIQRSAQEVLEA